MVKTISHTLFRKKYIRDLPDNFQWQTTPLQLYPLEFISEYLVLPTPVLRSDYYFMIYLHRGRYRHQISTEHYDVQAPSLVYIPIGELFSIKSIGEKLSGFFILMESKTIPSIRNKISVSELMGIKKVTDLDAGDDQWFKAICNLLYREVSSVHPNRNIGTALLQALLHRIIDLSGGEKTFSRQREIAQNFKQLSNRHCKEDREVRFYAKKLNVSENYLNRCVKEHFNKSCKQLLQETTILQSQVLMFETTRDISEISFEMGFEDPSYFSRVFKKVTGQTPSSFKKQIAHGLS